MQKKTINSLQTSQHIKLSIQCSLGGFSFCIQDIATNNTIVFTEYIFEELLENPTDLVAKIETIFKTDTNLQQDFESVFVVHQNTLATLVPTPFFDEQKLKSYLDFNIKTLVTDYISYDDLQEINAKNVYIPYVNVNNFIFQHFGEFEYQHHTSVLLKKLIQDNTGKTKKMYVNVTESTLDIVVLEDTKLLLLNSFEFYTKEDFVYYILFVAEQLQLNTEEFPLVFLGGIEEDSELYKMVYGYVRNVSFIKSNTTIFKNSEDFSEHSNYILAG